MLMRDLCVFAASAVGLVRVQVPGIGFVIAESYPDPVVIVTGTQELSASNADASMTGPLLSERGVALT